MGRRGRPPFPRLAQGSPAPGWHRGALWWGRSYGAAISNGTVSCAGDRGGLFWEQNQHGTHCLIQPHWMDLRGKQVLGAPQSMGNVGICHFSLLSRGDYEAALRNLQFLWQPAAAPSPTEAAMRSHVISLIISFRVDLEPRPS